MPEVKSQSESSAIQPNENKPSEKTFNGYFIPAHNAKKILEGFKKGDSPLLPKNGELSPVAIYNSRTGYILNADTLIPAQIMKQEMGYESNVVSTAFNLKDAGTQRKQGEKGLMFNYKTKDDRFQTSSYFFGDQAENPQKVAEFAAKNHLKDKKILDGISYEVKSADDYLPAYLAAAKSGMKVTVSPEITEQFKANMTAICENQKLAEYDKNKDKSLPKLNEYLYQCDRKSVDLVHEVAASHNIELPKKKEPEQKNEQKKEQKRDERKFNKEEMLRGL